MNPNQLHDHLAAISNLMKFQMQNFVTPISGALVDKTAKHVGTGGYVEWNKTRFLLTNEHVARAINKHSLAQKFFDSQHYLRINNPFSILPAPHDLAISQIDDSWETVIHSAMAFPHHRFATQHAPYKYEYLFIMGFTGEKSHYSPSFNTLFTTCTPYLTQEYDETLESEDNRRKIKHPDFDPNYHFAMHWHPELTNSTDGRKSTIPLDPHGMSGSFVWNTRFMEFHQRGETWTPSVARLTGILWGWDTTDRFLFATRIEHIKKFLENLLSN